MFITYMWEPTSVVLWLLCQKLHLPGKFMCQENLCIFGTCLCIDLLHTCVYVQEKKCEPLGTSYTTKSSILNKKTTTVSPFSGSRLFGGCSVSKTTALSYERERERQRAWKLHSGVPSSQAKVQIQGCYHNVQQLIC